MEKVKGITKGGWHPPGKDGKSKESWRGDFKGINQVAGWVGKGKDPHQAAQEHQSRPLATLKNPDAFGPPPKHVSYHGGAAVPNAITPDRRGLGAPLSAEDIHAQQEREESEKRAQEEAAQKPVPPPVPYRVDTTGLSTASLPKPPVRRIDAAQPSSPQSNSRSAALATKPKPSLPPRLPPRDSSNPTLDPPPSYKSAVEAAPAGTGLNQGALIRLGSAGVSVPGLNIGGHTDPPTSYQGQAEARTTGPTTTQKSTLGELHSRFSGLSNRSPATETPSGGGTSFAQKQAALKTASSLRSDPSSVSFEDARTTAATANNFRERHGDQVTSGLKSASAINQKYNVTGQIARNSGNSSVEEKSMASPSIGDAPDSAMFGSKKKPPPVPLSSKPQP